MKAKGQHGGYRPGAGRKKVVEDFTPPAAAEDSLDFLRSVMNDLSQKPELRVRAAISLAQYEHPKIGEAGKKGIKKESAQEVAKGKFGPGTAPLRSVK